MVANWVDSNGPLGSGSLATQPGLSSSFLTNPSINTSFQTGPSTSKNLAKNYPSNLSSKSANLVGQMVPKTRTHRVNETIKNLISSTQVNLGVNRDP